MALYVGFDCLAYPGLDEMTWLKANTNLSWCGFYLAPAPSHSDSSWSGNRGDLIALGWGVAPIYVGQQTSGPGSHNVNGAQGTTDGTDAATLANAAGFPNASFLYLDIEDGSALTDVAKAYVASWILAVVAGGYSPGIYCSHLIAQQVADLVDTLNPTPNTRIWAYKVTTVDPHPYTGDPANFPSPNPSSSGFAGASALQYEQNAILSLPTAPTTSLTVDLSSSNIQDPGAAGAAGIAEISKLLFARPAKKKAAKKKKKNKGTRPPKGSSSKANVTRNSSRRKISRR